MHYACNLDNHCHCYLDSVNIFFYALTNMEKNVDLL